MSEKDKDVEQSPAEDDIESELSSSSSAGKGGKQTSEMLARAAIAAHVPSEGNGKKGSIVVLKDTQALHGFGLSSREGLVCGLIAFVAATVFCVFGSEALSKLIEDGDSITPVPGEMVVNSKGEIIAYNEFHKASTSATIVLWCVLLPSLYIFFWDRWVAPSVWPENNFAKFFVYTSVFIPFFFFIGFGVALYKGSRDSWDGVNKSGKFWTSQVCIWSVLVFWGLTVLSGVIGTIYAVIHYASLDIPETIRRSTYRFKGNAILTEDDVSDAGSLRG